MKTLGVIAASVVALLLSACGDSGSSGAGGAGGEGGGDGGSNVGGVDEGGASCHGTEPTDDPRLSEAADLLRDLLRDKNLPGGALAIVEDGEILGIAVAGSKNWDECDPVTQDTLFGTGWATQLVTAVAALDAVEDRKLDLYAPMTEVIPELHVGNTEYGDASQITLHQLLTSTSMYWVKSDNTAGHGYPDLNCFESLDDVVSDANEPVLYAVPGSMQDTNAQSNAELVGLALESVEGRGFSDIVKTRVLDPLDMGGGFDTAEIEASDHADGQNPIQGDCRNRHPSTGYHGSVRDMAKLLAYLTGGAGDVLEPAMRDGMLSAKAEAFWKEPVFAAYGICGLHDERIDDDVFTIASDANFEEDLIIYRNRRLAVVLLVNGVTGRAAEPILFWTWKIAQIYAEPDDELINVAKPERDFIPNDPAMFPSLVATYRDDMGFNGITWRQLDVFIDEQTGRLAATLTTSDGGAELIGFEDHYTQDNFVFTADGLEYPARFWRDDAGDGYAIQLQFDAGPPFYRLP